MEILANKWSEFCTWVLRKKVLWNLKKANGYSVEVEKVMEQFATRQILSGKSEGSVSRSRQVLVKHQETIKVKEDFQEFLKSL